MQFTTALVSILATAVIAIPTGNTGGGSAPYVACSGLYSSLQCCATDVLGAADLDCHSPTNVPTSASNFRSICANVGQRARCCVISVLGQAVLCQTPVGV
ncbi:fungal hydrophobin [Colletotrichum abscissum]|uniref:Fungal hydrophobin n=2 Tax=Colletotrichum acutatum species complex TaxID=2707335 RepID=A0A9P9X6X2_9PEZI|nr:fungal hydrophobin [Colletotrichum lupini]XP_060404155.1 fungal hydrophobin [Colletotrichum abscissum]KAI3539675.1 fungal hydrophobin [Colletotrichum abscissum]KAK1516285.1 fungal hydrophobin [Colletotrichum abscissum]KAK1702522.1 fungal hydrophobin [Colletotrichum lupini]UQC81712.1 fungal hydrophobin [Colletotrichum lupini]